MRGTTYLLALLALVLAAPAAAQSTAKGYTIVEVEVTDPPAFMQFAQQLRMRIEAAGGRYLATPAGRVEVHEAEAPNRLAIIEWDSVDEATAFYRSAAFTDLIPARDASARLIRLFTVSGEASQ